MTVAKAAACAVSLAALCACGGYPAPRIETPAAYQAVEGSDPAAERDAQWWLGFENAELTALVTEARTNNREMRATVARILQAEAQATSARSLLFPSLGLGASVNRSERQRDVVNGDGTAADTVTTTATSAGVNLQASYQLDLFGQIRNAARSTGARFESTLYDGLTVEITLTANVITTYLQVLSARERLMLAERRLANAETILDLLETQRRVGSISDLELAQQRSAIASQRASIPALRLAERQSLNALAVLVGRAPEGFDVAGRTLGDVILPTVSAGIPSDLLRRRPDLRSAEAGLDAANFDVAAARAARLPAFSLTGQGGTSTGALADLFSAGTFAWSLGASASQTLFAGGRLRANEQAARANYRATYETYRGAVLAALRDVENALSAVTQNGQQYTLAQEAYEQAEYAYRLAELRYRAGAEPFQTMLTAQNSVFQTQESLVQTGLSRFSAVISLTQALGGGWDGTRPEPPSLQLISAPLE